MEENLVEKKSMAFAVRIVRLYQFLTSEKKEFVMSKQLLRSGTSIGANIREGTQAFSKSDFTFKMNTALKECNETGYWLELLYKTDYLSAAQFDSIFEDAKELLKILTSIVKTAKADESN